MFNKTITKEELKKLADNPETGQIIVQTNDNWRWPNTGEDQNTCRLLDFLMDVEYRSGTLVFLPDKVNKCKMIDRNKD